MKILRIMAQGLELFRDDLDILFYTQQRVSESDREKLYPLFSNIYLNNAEAFIGVNASGKTSVLKVILLALGILNNEPVNYLETKGILGESKKAVFNLYFYSDAGEVCRLETVITSVKKQAEGIRYKILEESLWTKPDNAVKTKKNLIDFSKSVPIAVRSEEEDFLSEDVSIVIAYNRKHREHIEVSSLLSLTNSNSLPFSEDISEDIISFLDPMIEKLYFDRSDKKTLVHIKFKGKDEIIINNPADLELYLSSGTIKGIVTFQMARNVLKSGGYLVVDEIENHFNKEIVATLIRFFMDTRLNKHGGTLIFSTHYPEILDEYDRNDSIYIMRNRDGITADNLCSLLKRNDIKKSEAYESGLLDGTVPAYEAYLQLKKSLAASL